MKDFEKQFEKAVKEETNKALRKLTPKIASDINRRIAEKWKDEFGELPTIRVTSTPVQLTKNGVKNGNLYYSWDAEDEVSQRIEEILTEICK